MKGSVKGSVFVFGFVFGLIFIFVECRWTRLCVRLCAN